MTEYDFLCGPRLGSIEDTLHHDHRAIPERERVAAKTVGVNNDVARPFATLKNKIEAVFALAKSLFVLMRTRHREVQTPTS